MGVDPVTRPASDLLGDACHSAVLDVGRVSAARADDVMVVARFAGHVRVVPVGQLQALDDAQLHEEIEGAKDRCPADGKVSCAGVGGEVGRSEMAFARRDQARDQSARFSHPPTGAVQGVEEGNRLARHGQMILGLIKVVQDAGCRRTDAVAKARPKARRNVV
jgi:hypothetical protein